MAAENEAYIWIGLYQLRKNVLGTEISIARVRLADLAFCSQVIVCENDHIVIKILPGNVGGPVDRTQPWTEFKCNDQSVGVARFK